MISNTNEAWGWPARTFHWVIALMIIIVFALGLWMADVPARAERPFYFGIHGSIGITLLLILGARFAWSMINRPPDAPPGTPAWQVTAARLTHASLYILTFTAAVLGWLLAGSLHPPIDPQAFGLVPVPAPVNVGSYDDFVEEAHELVAFALIAVATLHAAASLWHHFVLRDNVLRRMLVGARKTT